jgi:ribosomal protein S12 methylthiotransferase accessory factor YcaO
MFETVMTAGCFRLVTNAAPSLIVGGCAGPLHPAAAAAAAMTELACLQGHQVQQQQDRGKQEVVQGWETAANN